MEEKLSNKTCGECRYYEHPAGQCMKVIEYNNCHITDKACEYFEPKVITNGDVIRQGGNRALAAFQQLNTCDNCVYNNDSRLHTYCDKPIDKTCTDGIEAWLNAPAESEVGDE